MDIRKLAASRGIVDAEAGITTASHRRQEMLSGAAPFMKAGSSLTLGHFALMALLTRAHGFHDATAREIAQDNPFAAHGLLRSYAENAAVMAWLIDRPLELVRMAPTATQKDRFSIGPLIAAAQKRLPGFKGLYEHLSGFSHPSYLGVLASVTARADANDGSFTWQSKPKFRQEEEVLMAYFWLSELAEVNGRFWQELAGAYAQTLAMNEADVEVLGQLRDR